MEGFLAKDSYGNYIDSAGWLLSLIVPIIFYFSLSLSGVAPEVVLFLSVLSSAIVMWIFRLVSEYLPGILVIICCAALGLVPSSTILAGFSSETFMMVFSVLAITILIARSSLMPRFILTLLKVLPKKQKYFDAVFFICFTFLTPLIPSITSRTQLVGASLTRFISMFNLKTGSTHITKLTAHAFFGASLFSNIFISSSLMNFIILALLPLQEQLQFQLAGWLQASFVAFIVMLVSYAIVFSFFFKKDDSMQFSKDLIIKQLDTLGPISKDEWVSLAAVAVFFVGMLTFPYHKISPTWIAFSLAYVLLAFNILTREEIQSKVDWTFLLFMASVIGISSMMNYFNIAGAISEKFQAFIEIFGGSSGIIFSFLVVFTIVVRLFLPIGATVALLIPVFVSLAGLCGVTCWAACFTCLIVADMWFFKYQCSFYTAMVDAFSGSGVPYDERKFLMFNAFVNIARILAIFASFYYWQWLGL